MDWGKFFEETRRAAGVDSFAKLAPLLHVTDGAISHYRTGRSIPMAWTVAAALRIQGHKEPEKEAARIMREVGKSAEERAFWRKLGAGAAVAAVALTAFAMPGANHGQVLETLAFFPVLFAPNAYYVLAGLCALAAALILRRIAAQLLPAIPVSRFEAQGAPA